MKRGGEFANSCWQVSDIVCGSSVLCVWSRSARVLASVHLRAREREREERRGLAMSSMICARGILSAGL